MHSNGPSRQAHLLSMFTIGGQSISWAAEGSGLRKGAKFQIHYSLWAVHGHDPARMRLRGPRGRLGRHVKFSVEDFDMDTLNDCAEPAAPWQPEGNPNLHTRSHRAGERLDDSPLHAPPAFVANTAMECGGGLHATLCHSMSRASLAIWFLGIPLIFASPCCETAQRNYEEDAGCSPNSSPRGSSRATFAMQGRGGGTTQGPSPGRRCSSWSAPQ